MSCISSYPSIDFIISILRFMEEEVRKLRCMHCARGYLLFKLPLTDPWILKKVDLVGRFRFELANLTVR